MDRLAQEPGVGRHRVITKKMLLRIVRNEEHADGWPQREDVLRQLLPFSSGMSASVISMSIGPWFDQASSTASAGLSHSSTVYPTASRNLRVIARRESSSSTSRTVRDSEAAAAVPVH